MNIKFLLKLATAFDNEANKKDTLIQVLWSFRNGELNGEIVTSTENVPYKIVFLEGYRNQSGYRGQLPKNGEEWVCRLVRDTQPGQRKGALIVRLISRAEKKRELKVVSMLPSGAKLYEAIETNGLKESQLGYSKEAENKSAQFMSELPDLGSLVTKICLGDAPPIKNMDYWLSLAGEGIKTNWSINYRSFEYLAFKCLSVNGVHDAKKAVELFGEPNVIKSGSYLELEFPRIVTLSRNNKGKISVPAQGQMLPEWKISSGLIGLSDNKIILKLNEGDYDYQGVIVGIIDSAAGPGKLYPASNILDDDLLAKAQHVLEENRMSEETILSKQITLQLIDLENKAKQSLTIASSLVDDCDIDVYNKQKQYQTPIRESEDGMGERGGEIVRYVSQEVTINTPDNNSLTFSTTLPKSHTEEDKNISSFTFRKNIIEDHKKTAKQILEDVDNLLEEIPKGSNKNEIQKIQNIKGIASEILSLQAKENDKTLKEDWNSVRSLFNDVYKDLNNIYGTTEKECRELLDGSRELFSTTYDTLHNSVPMEVKILQQPIESRRKINEAILAINVVKEKIKLAKELEQEKREKEILEREQTQEREREEREQARAQAREEREQRKRDQRDQPDRREQNKPATTEKSSPLSHNPFAKLTLKK
jgi:hypothetical protein